MAEDHLNIILIVADTLRRDHLGCYGNTRIATPHLDRLAARSIVFDHSAAGSYPTVPARFDLLTGKYGFARHGWAPMPQDEVTLPQLLSGEAGYLSMGIVDTPFYLRQGYGYDRGFSDFIWIRGQRRGAERWSVTRAWRHEEDRFVAQTMAAGEKWLEANRGEKFFLLLDTWDPHEPWCAPDYYVERYYPGYAGQPAPWPSYWYWREAGMTEEELKLGHAHYCGEVTMVDRWIGRVLERLESLGLMDNTAVIFASDHGFYFGEHGLFGKAMMRTEEGGYVMGPDTAGDSKGSMTMLFRDPETGEIGPGSAQWWRSPLYDEVTRVPLLIYLPDTAARRIDAMVTTPDLMATILELAGVAIPDTVQAPSLMPLVRGETERLHDFVITSWPLYNPGQTIRVVDDWSRIVTQPLPSTIDDGEWTLLYAMGGEPAELYHRPSDPNLENNVLAANSAAARELHTRFTGFLEKHGTPDALLEPRRIFP